MEIHPITPDGVYLKLDQTAPETITNGIPLLESSHAAFTDAHQLIDKEYVDDITLGTYFDFYAYDDASDVGGYKEFKLTPSTGIEVEGVVNIPGNATDEAVGARITEDTIDVFDLMTVISSGIFTFHVHLEAATANRLKFYAELYVRDDGDVETLICTTIATDFIGTVCTGYNSHGDIPTSIALEDGDRLVVKGYATNASPAATNLTVAVEGDTATRVNLPGITSPAHHGSLTGLDDVDDHLLYLDLAGARAMTGDLKFDYARDYKFAYSGLAHFGLTSTGADEDMRLQLFAEAGDGVKAVAIDIFGKGTLASTDDYERMIIGWNQTNSQYEIYTHFNGGGFALKPLSFYASGVKDQLLLNIDGTLSMSGALDLTAIAGSFAWTGLSAITMSDEAKAFYIADGHAGAFIISTDEGAVKYLWLDTTNGSEVINLGNGTTDPDLTLLGTGTTSLNDTNIDGDLVVSGTDGTVTAVQFVSDEITTNPTLVSGTYRYNSQTTYDGTIATLGSSTVILAGMALGHTFETALTAQGAGVLYNTGLYGTAKVDSDITAIANGVDIYNSGLNYVADMAGTWDGATNNKNIEGFNRGINAGATLDVVLITGVGRPCVLESSIFYGTMTGSPTLTNNGDADTDLILNYYGLYLDPSPGVATRNGGDQDPVVRTYGIYIAEPTLGIAQADGDVKIYGYYQEAIDDVTDANYGIYLGAVSGATADNNWAIYSAGGDSYLTDDLTIGGTLTVTGGMPYTELSDGTAGELITWAADTTIDTVAAGNSNQVLTSNGAGLAPTFQDVPGGSPTVGYWALTPADIQHTYAPVVADNVNYIVTGADSWTTFVSGYAWAAVHLPHGATITGCKVYADDASEAWTLRRYDNDDAGGLQTLATAHYNAAEVTVSSNNVVNNSLYKYTIALEVVVSDTDTIYGGYVKFTYP